MLGRKALLGALLALSLTPPAVAQPRRAETIVLVHGAFAESASWNAVITRLEGGGYRVIAAANPLRSLHGDAEALAALVRSIDGPVVLVGHSYGGPVITVAAAGSHALMVSHPGVVAAMIAAAAGAE